MGPINYKLTNHLLTFSFARWTAAQYPSKQRHHAIPRPSLAGPQPAATPTVHPSAARIAMYTCTAICWLWNRHGYFFFSFLFKYGDLTADRPSQSPILRLASLGSSLSLSLSLPSVVGFGRRRWYFFQISPHRIRNFISGPRFVARIIIMFF